jgi:putative aldouronate transport system substrate-binding protein
VSVAPTDQIAPSLNRRQFLQLAASATTLTVFAAACAPIRPPAGLPSTQSEAASAHVLPAHIDFANVPQADLPGSANGVDPAYFKFPSALVRSVPTPPGDGSELSPITLSPYGTPPPVEQNAAWQAVNQQTGVNLKLVLAPTTEYVPKLNTLLAGTDLPDFIYNAPFSPYGVIPSLPDVARRAFADLTPHLTGDAIKAYPNLANYSTYSWQTGLVDGRLYGVPVSRGPFGSVLMWRQDLFDSVGISESPRNADEFKRMLIAVTRPQDNTWGIAVAGGGGVSWGLGSTSPLLAMFGVPNVWRLENGNLVRDFETQEYRAAVDFVRDLYTAGAFHPKSTTYSSAEADTDFRAGRFAVYPNPWGGWLLTWSALAASNPQARLRPLHPFAHDGGATVYHSGSGNFGVTYVKQSSPDRVKLLLNVLNVLAAPFGTEEWLVNYYGARDVDYTFDAQGAPEPTAQGRADTAAAWRYVTSPPPVLFDPARSMDFATISHAAEQAMVAARIDDPTRGLYSPTAFKSAITAETAWYAGLSEIVQGRRPMADMDQLLADWRRTAGDAMRAEYLTQLESATR